MFSIALDGPAGAGKSTIAKRIAKELKIIHVDTGAMYRAIALYYINKGIDTKDKESVVAGLEDIKVKIRFTEEDGQKIFLNGEDVTKAIRTSEVSMGASNVSSLPEVRKFLLHTQRHLAKKHSVIMDGRDIGTVILPDATLKIFLTASAEVRAERRLKEYLEDGVEITYDEVLRDVMARDEQDRTRAASPLKQADDAILANTSGMEFEDSVKYILSIIRERIKDI